MTTCKWQALHRKIFEKNIEKNGHQNASWSVNIFIYNQTTPETWISEIQVLRLLTNSRAKFDEKLISLEFKTNCR